MIYHCICFWVTATGVDRRVAELPATISAIVNAVEDETNFRMFVMLAGPMPDQGGKIGFLAYVFASNDTVEIADEAQN